MSDLENLLAIVDRLNPCAKKSELDKCAREYERLRDTGEAGSARISVEVDGLAFVMLAQFLDDLKSQK